MASAWFQSRKEPRTDGLVTTYQALPQAGRHQVCIKTKLSLLMKRVLNMSKCSQSSLSLLVRMRDQLKEALEQEGIFPPESPCSQITDPSRFHSTVRHPQQTKSEAASMSSNSSPLEPINANMKHWDCAYCVGFMVQPVCLPCGHSVCKNCLDKSVVGGDVIACPYCNHICPCVPVGFGPNASSSSSGGSRGVDPENVSTAGSRRPTLLLQNAVQKWYPEWVESGKHKDEGNVFANEGDFPMAVHWYSKALQTGQSARYR